MKKVTPPLKKSVCLLLTEGKNQKATQTPTWPPFGPKTGKHKKSSRVVSNSSNMLLDIALSSYCALPWVNAFQYQLVFKEPRHQWRRYYGSTKTNCGSFRARTRYVGIIKHEQHVRKVLEKKDTFDICKHFRVLCFWIDQVLSMW